MEASHAHWNRQTTNDMLFTKLSSDSKTLQSMVDPFSWPTAECYYGQHTLLGRGENEPKLSTCRYLRMLAGIHERDFLICLSSELGQHHMLCLRTSALSAMHSSVGIDSKLNYTIRLLRDVLKASASNSGCWSADGIIDISCCLIELLTLRYRIEQQHSTVMTATAEQVSANCRSVLEFSQSLSVEGILDVRTYCSYVLTELTLGNELEAVKVSHLPVFFPTAHVSERMLRAEM
jgi:hypothetical protein